MASRTLAGLSAVLCSARSLPEALIALVQELAEADRGAQLAVYEHDQPQGVLCRRTVIADGEAKVFELNVSLDHFPGPVRKALLLSKQFTDLGTQSDEYMKLLGFPSAHESGAFLLRGCTLDGELAAVIALHEPKRVFGPKVSERITPAVDLFVLALEKLCEREARLEATMRLEQLTRQLHDEHARVISDLERKLALAHAASSGDETESDRRIAELEAAAEKARVDARVTAQRLSAVEEQVESAVGRLEKAHRQLYEQSEAVTQQRNLIYRIERMLRDNSSDDTNKLVEDLLAVVSSSPSVEQQ
jgi:hypothetical protein